MHNLDLILALAGGFTAALILGYARSAGIVFGMALAVASTVVLIRVLADHRDLHTPIDRQRDRAHRDLFGHEPAESAKA